MKGKFNKDGVYVPKVNPLHEILGWTAILIFLSALVGLVFLFIYYPIPMVSLVAAMALLSLIIHLLSSKTNLMDQRCKICKEKRKWFFGAWETNLEWSKEINGYVKFPDLYPNDVVCTTCAQEHKLFDNYDQSRKTERP